MVHEHEVTICWSDSVEPLDHDRLLDVDARRAAAPSSSAGQRRPGRRRPSAARHPGRAATSRYSASDSRAGRQGQAEAELGPGREPLGVGQGQAGPAQCPLPHPGHVALAGEADLAELGEAEADTHVSPSPRSPAPRRSHPARGRAGAGRRRGQESYRHLAPGREILARALAAAGRRHGRGHHVLDAEAGAGAAVVARGPPAVGQPVLGQGVLPVLPQEVPVQAGRDVVPGQHLVLGPVPVDRVLQGQPVGGQGVGPQVEVEVLRPLLEGAARRATPAR